MALSEFETKKIEKEVSAFVEKRRPPPHIRNEVDIGYRIEGQSVEIFKIRPHWRHPGKKIEEISGKGDVCENTKGLDSLLAKS